GREFGIVDRTGEQPERRIQEHGVDAVRIHVGHAGMRVEPALAAFVVLHRITGDDALARADPAGAAEPGLRAAEDLLLDDEALLAVLVLDQPRRPIAEAGLHVIVPQIERLDLWDNYMEPQSEEHTSELQSPYDLVCRL